MADSNLLGLWEPFFVHRLLIFSEFLDRYYNEGPEVLVTDFPLATETEDDLNELISFCDAELFRFVLEGIDFDAIKDVSFRTRTEIRHAFEKYSLKNWDIGYKHYAAAKFIKSQGHTICPSQVATLDVFGFSTSPQVGLFVQYLNHGLSLDELKNFCIQGGSKLISADKVEDPERKYLLLRCTGIQLNRLTEGGKNEPAKAND